MVFPCKLYAPLCVFAVLSACVRPKIYRAELAARHAFEARSQTLAEDLAVRRTQLEMLIDTNGQLNRTLGERNSRIRTLEMDIATLTREHGESASRLAAQKSTLERELAARDARLAVLDTIAQLQSTSRQALGELQSALNLTLTPVPGFAEATFEFDDRSLQLIIPDRQLFDVNGIGLHAAGRHFLGQLSQVIAQRPELAVEIVGYTDNQLPKALKDLGDTWQWSLQRATNVVRMLVRDYNINPNQLSAVGRGEFYPVASNETPEGRQKNRRLVLVFLPKMARLPKAGR